MEAMIATVIEFKGGAEVSTSKDVIEPTVYDDGTVGIEFDLVGTEKHVYARFKLSDLVQIALTAERESTE